MSGWNLPPIQYKFHYLRDRITLFDPDQFTLRWLSQFGRIEQKSFNVFFLHTRQGLTVCDLIDGINLLCGHGPEGYFGMSDYEEYEDLLPDPPPFPGAKGSAYGVTEDYPGQRSVEIGLAVAASVLGLAAAVLGALAILAARGG